MPQDSVAIDNILKDDYVGPVREQLNQQTRLLDIFVKDDISSHDFVGRQAIIPLHKSRNAGVKSGPEGATLPAAGKQGFAKLSVPPRFTWGRIELSAHVMKATKTNAGAFAQAMEVEQKGLVKDISRQRNRYLAGFGSGTLATVSAGANSATQALANPGGVSGTVNATRFINQNASQLLAITDSTGAILRGVQTVNSVSEPNIVLDSAVNTTTGDLVSVGTNLNAPGESSFGGEPMGLLGLIDSTTFVSSIHGLDRSLSANSFFRANILSNVGTMNIDAFNRIIDNTEEISGEIIDTILGHYSLRREYIKLTEADRRYDASSGAKNFDAGNEAVKKDPTVSTYPFKVDKDLPYGIVFGLSKDHLLWLPETEGEWADDDGKVLLRVKDKDNYEGRYRISENFYSDMGNAFFRMDGVTATTTSGVFSL